MSWAIREKDFKFFHGPNKAILELKNRKLIQKLTIFGQIDIRVLAILGPFWPNWHPCFGQFGGPKSRIQKFVGKKREIFFSFYLNLLSYQGERVSIFPRTQQGIIRAQKSKMDLKIDHFWPNWHPCFGHFGGPKSLIQKKFE